MSINERIDLIKSYFITFNVHDDVAYVLVKFPAKWSLFNKTDIEASFNVKIAKRDEGIFFLCDIKDGFDILFDAIDYIVSNNLSLEEKTALLEAKVKELSEIFMNESLEKLKTLEFTFPQTKKVGKASKSNVKNISKEPAVSQRKNNKNSDIDVVNDKPITIEKNSDIENIIDTTTSTSKSKKIKNKNNVKNSSMVDFAKTLIDSDNS